MDDTRPAGRRASSKLARVGSAFLLSVAGQTHAACTQADLAGTWNAYIGGAGFFQRCVFAIGANGVVRSGTWCITDWGDKYAVTGGRIVLGSACQGSGTITMKGPYANVITARITNATLDRRKTYAAGIGSNDFGQGFMFNLIKR